MATILVVDDDFRILDLLTDVLESESDHTVIAATNGREALQRLRENHVDAVVCDVNMSVMNGIELVREMRSDTFLREMPVVMISALMHPEDIDPDLDVDLLLEKPFDVKALLASVSFVLGRVRAGATSARVTKRLAAWPVNLLARDIRRSAGSFAPATS
ncbi:MAG TPA: response regulator [Thermomicrobiales bacterium]|nr:response regulator [Thermomicrobiales bacterium]